MHGPHLSLAGVDGIGRHRVEARCRRSRDASGMPGRPAAPAISPRRFRGRHRAACIARLSAGLRTRGSGAGCPAPPPSLLPGTTAPVRIATASPPTAAGQCRNPCMRTWTGFPFHPQAKAW